MKSKEVLIFPYYVIVEHRIDIFNNVRYDAFNGKHYRTEKGAKVAAKRCKARDYKIRKIMKLLNEVINTKD